MFVLALFKRLAVAFGRPGRRGGPLGRVIVLRKCALDYERTASLGSTQSEVLEESLVEPGDRVKAGQVLW